MKKSPTIFLQVVIVIIGIGTVALMLWEPHIEGRNAHATLFEIYFKDPFLAYVYIASTPFFMALYQSFKVLRYVRQDNTFSQATVKGLRTIKYCAIVLASLIVAAEVYLFIAMSGKDDIAGGVAMGLFMIFTSVVVATVTGMFERILKNVLDINIKTT